MAQVPLEDIEFADNPEPRRSVLHRRYLVLAISVALAFIGLWGVTVKKRWDWERANPQLAALLHAAQDLPDNHLPDNNYLKSEALAAVGEVIAKTDPQQTKPVFEQALHVAQGISDDYYKLKALTAIAKAMLNTSKEEHH